MSTQTEEASGTKAALIEAALVLFAEKGFDLVSVRDITGRAGANVASVKYHFGSRENLMDAVLAQLISPVNEERLRRIHELEKQGRFEVREILEALFEPLLNHIKSSPVGENLFCRLMGRIVAERSYEVPAVIMDEFRLVGKSFIPALMKAVPGLDQAGALWQMHFSFGALSSALMHRDLLRQISEGTVGDEDLETTFTRIINFCESGFKK